MYSRLVKCVCLGVGGGGSLRFKIPNSMSFWKSEFLTHPVISVFQSLSFFLEFNFSVDVWGLSFYNTPTLWFLCNIDSLIRQSFRNQK